MKLTEIPEKDLKQFLENKELQDISFETKSFIFGDTYTFTLNIISESQTITALTQVFRNKTNKKMSHYEDLFAESCKDLFTKVGVLLES